MTALVLSRQAVLGTLVDVLNALTWLEPFHDRAPALRVRVLDLESPYDLRLRDVVADALVTLLELQDVPAGLLSPAQRTVADTLPTLVHRCAILVTDRDMARPDGVH